MFVSLVGHDMHNVVLVVVLMVAPCGGLLVAPCGGLLRVPL